MPALNLAPVLTFLATLQRVSPVVPLRTFLRTTSNRLRPCTPQPFVPTFRRAQAAVLAAGRAGLHQLANVRHEPHGGPLPTLVLGGFVPDSTEQVFLLRGHLAKAGPLYYLNYPPDGFSLELVCAQLDDLVAEIRQRHGQDPVIFAVSFGGGLALDWLRRRQGAASPTPIAGLVLVSPVACVADLIAPDTPRPATLLGRALAPYLADEPVTASAVEKSRAIFARMFEAGAQNRGSLAFLLTRNELARLRGQVMATIRRVTARGACERVRALRAMPEPGGDFSPPLTTAPVLVLYAEREEAVLAATSPTRRQLERDGRRQFPHLVCRVICNPRGAPVQHASLIFHGFNFLPAITTFYHGLKSGKFGRAA